jgi:hypothetical protein
LTFGVVVLSGTPVHAVPGRIRGWLHRSDEAPDDEAAGEASTDEDTAILRRGRTRRRQAAMAEHAEATRLAIGRPPRPHDPV